MLLSIIPYIIFSIVNLVSILMEKRKIKYITKVFLMPTLLIFYIMNTKDIQPLIIFALALGFLGDTALISKKDSVFFIGGLAFLLGHICYIQLFKATITLTSVNPNMIVFILIYVVYIGLLFRWIKHHATSPFNKLMNKIALIYMSIICIMSFFSLIRYGLVDRLSFFIAFIGTVLFVISDSLLMFKKTVKYTAKTDFGVMITYLLAQFLIVFSFI